METFFPAQSNLCYSDIKDASASNFRTFPWSDIPLNLSEENLDEGFEGTKQENSPCFVCLLRFLIYLLFQHQSSGVTWQGWLLIFEDIPFLVDVLWIKTHFLPLKVLLHKKHWVYETEV